MSLYKRGDSEKYWCAFSVNGQRIQRSTGTTDKDKAAEYEARLRASIYDQSRLGIKPSYTWNDAVIRYVRENTHKTASTQDSERRILVWLDTRLSGKPLESIDRVLLDTIIASKQQEGVKPRTINSVTNLIRVVLRKAMLDWEWIDRLPKFRILKEPTRRVRFITREEAARLLAELPPHLNRMARFALETGLRRANVTHLRWSQVDLDRRTAWIHPDEAKSAKAIPVPLSEAATVVLREAMGEHADFVFTYKGKPVVQTGSTAWEKACARCGITDFRWHDLRHTWASWHVQDGTPLHVLQELGGWESADMVRKYAHLSTAHLADYVNNRNIRFADKIETVLTTVKKTAKSKTG